MKKTVGFLVLGSCSMLSALSAAPYYSESYSDSSQQYYNQNPSQSYYMQGQNQPSYNTRQGAETQPYYNQGEQNVQGWQYQNPEKGNVGNDYQRVRESNQTYDVRIEQKDGFDRDGVIERRTETYERPIEGRPYGRGVVIISDQDLNKKIRDAIGAGWFSKGYETVTFVVYNGNVTLRGTVDSPEDKRRVEEKVRNINGVKQVNNQITVSNRQQRSY